MNPNDPVQYVITFSNNLHKNLTENDLDVKIFNKHGKRDEFEDFKFYLNGSIDKIEYLINL